MDNMSIQNHLQSLSGIGQLGRTPEISPIPAPKSDQTGGAPKAEFKDLLAESISKVNNLMNDSDKAVQDLAAGKSTDVHQTLISLQKADVSFRMLMNVRNKVMKAYEDVMRTQA